MCESTAYLLRDGEEELFFENIDLIETGDEEVRLVNIFGEEKTVRAKIKALSLVEHKIVLKPLTG
jgi:predicted RNA-binding protein